MENFSFGLAVTGIGLLVVFVGLCILIAFIVVLSRIIRGKSANVKAPAPVAPAAPVAPVAPVAPAVQTSAPQAEPGLPAEVVAAITAAVAAVWQGETGFVVRHVKRVANAPVWNRAGREEQTYSRF